MLEKILIPVDGSTHNKSTFDLAKKIAANHNTKIILLNVGKLITHWTYSPVEIKNVEQKIKESSQSIVKKAKKHFKDSNLEIETKTTLGDPAIKIIDIAEKENCDMIIMHTHGMSATKRFTLGSVTNKVVHHSETPVLVVK
ncbi:MAG: universal stress protein [Firmicutes bacterium]|nr:universal stress protein [Bacillota bacterium]